VRHMSVLDLSATGRFYQFSAQACSCQCSGVFVQVGSIDALYDWERDRERVSQTWPVLNGSVQAPSEYT